MRHKLQSLALSGLLAAVVACMVALAVLPFSWEVSQAVFTCAIAVGILSAALGAITD
jgi:uncharacterized membrane protein YjjB (DUF3815 family)